VVVTLPTYNEAENIVPLVKELRALECDPVVLVADDDSPDGTWKLVEEMSEKDPKVRLLRRTADKGRGLAGAHAFVRALELDAEAIVEMDADFSHRPEFVPRLLEGLAGHDIVIGSRTVKGGRDVGRPWYRRLTTRISGGYVRLALGLGVRDPNSGFRAFRGEAMDRLKPGEFISSGPSIVHEVLYRARLNGLAMCEVPITFVDREAGQSKLGLGRLIDGWIKVLRLRWLHLTGKF